MPVTEKNKRQQRLADVRREWEQLHEVRIGPLQRSLKLDRLDELADGSEIIIDYKTGTVNRTEAATYATRHGLV